ncbi:MAG TPA: thiamine pyrophosphate-dependent enzyme [Planctomycetota bacterium]|nr:thiamine pyrophosphate-dependent enzyme [Planctomycetota bacterium]
MRTARSSSVEPASRSAAAEGTARPAGLADADLLALYRAMVEVRVFDTRMLMLQRQGRIGFYGPITGQEAATVASGFALGERDWVVPALREGALATLRGMPLEDAVAQCIGNVRDRARGRQMPCHYSWPKGRYVPMSSCVGNQLPAAVGIALAAKLRGDPAVVMAYLGDGATSTPDFHAAANFAGVWKAPVVFFCQNNHWAISVPAAAQTASETLAVKASAYGFEGFRIDGNEALEVFEATRRAVEKARSGGGPTLIEAFTYRILGHTSSDDPTRYRDEAEVRAWKGRDPVERLRARLEALGLSDRARDERLREEIDARVQAAIREVEAAPPPEPDSIFGDVLAEPTPALREQREEFRRFPRARA